MSFFPKTSRATAQVWSQLENMRQSAYNERVKEYTKKIGYDLKRGMEQLGKEAANPSKVQGLVTNLRQKYPDAPVEAFHYAGELASKYATQQQQWNDRQRQLSKEKNKRLQQRQAQESQEAMAGGVLESLSADNPMKHYLSRASGRNAPSGVGSSYMSNMDAVSGIKALKDFMPERMSEKDRLDIYGKQLDIKKKLFDFAEANRKAKEGKALKPDDRVFSMLNQYAQNLPGVGFQKNLEGGYPNIMIPIGEDGTPTAEGKEMMKIMDQAGIPFETGNPIKTEGNLIAQDKYAVPVIISGTRFVSKGASKPATSKTKTTYSKPQASKSTKNKSLSDIFGEKGKKQSRKSSPTSQLNEIKTPGGKGMDLKKGFQKAKRDIKNISAPDMKYVQQNPYFRNANKDQKVFMDKKLGKIQLLGYTPAPKDSKPVGTTKDGTIVFFDGKSWRKPDREATPKVWKQIQLMKNKRML